MLPDFRRRFTEKKLSSIAPTEYSMGYEKKEFGDKAITIEFLLSAILFLGSVFASIGLYIYSNFLDSQILSNKEAIINRVEAFKPEVVKEIIDFNKQIDSTKNVLSQRAPLNIILDDIQDSLVEDITIEWPITISRSEIDEYTITFEGSSSLDTYVQQSEAFEESTVFISPPKFNLNSTTLNETTFSFSGVINKQSQYYYGEEIEEDFELFPEGLSEFDLDI